MTRWTSTGKADPFAGGSAPMTQWQRERMAPPIIGPRPSVVRAAIGKLIRRAFGQ